MFEHLGDVVERQEARPLSHKRRSLAGHATTEQADVHRTGVAADSARLVIG